VRILIAGIGNVLRGDDGFGIAAMRALEEKLCQPQVEFFESGIAGISLVQKLVDGFDALIMLDALDRGGAPGQVYVLEPDLESLGEKYTKGQMVDLHQANPEGVLRLGSALGVMPEHVWIIGCQAVGCDELGAPLSEPVARAVPLVVERVTGIVEKLSRKPISRAAG
jgi:hydrogenase maturation protease